MVQFLLEEKKLLLRETSLQIRVITDRYEATGHIALDRLLLDVRAGRLDSFRYTGSLYHDSVIHLK